MASTGTSIVRTWSRLATVVLLGAVAVLVGPAAPAAAHGQLAVSRPVKDSRVDTPLRAVELLFTEQPATFAYVTVTGPDGRRVDNRWSPGQPERLDKPVQEYFLIDGSWQPRLYHMGYPASVAIAHWPRQGAYTVAYQSVASDGDSVKGTFSFTYTGPVTAAPAGWTPPTDGPSSELVAAQRADGHADPAVTGASPAPGDSPAPVAVPRGDAGGGSVLGWLVPVGVVLAAAGVLFAVTRRGPARAATRPASRTGRPAGGAGRTRKSATRGTGARPGRRPR